MAVNPGIIPGATHETTEVLFRDNPDDGDKISIWKIRSRPTARFL